MTELWVCPRCAKEHRPTERIDAGHVWGCPACDMAMVDVTPRRDTGQRTRPRGYAPWTPRFDAEAIVGQVEDVLAEYADHLPLTVRQVFYRLVGSVDYPKTEKAYKRLGEIIVRARRARMIPFDAIRDDSVVSMGARWYSDPAGFWDEAGQRARRYKRDRQQEQSVYLELWCEAAGMMPQLQRVADGYSVEVFSAGGFVSLSGVRLIVNRAVGRDRPTVILHVGDYDPSGESIFAHVIEDAAAFVAADHVVGSQRLYGHRLALTADQVADYELPTAPPKATDSRSRNWNGETCQLEALAPDELADIVTEGIEDWIDADRLDHQVDLEQTDRQQILKALPPAAQGGRTEES